MTTVNLLSPPSDYFGVYGSGQPTVRENAENASEAQGRIANIIEQSPLNIVGVATIIVDYEFPTPLQKKFLKVYDNLMACKGFEMYVEKCIPAAPYNDITELVLVAVNKIGTDLQYASPRLQDTQEVVFSAVRRSGWALKFASPNFKNNRELVLLALKTCGAALQFASPELRSDEELRRIAPERMALGNVTIIGYNPPLKQQVPPPNSSRCSIS